MSTVHTSAPSTSSHSLSEGEEDEAENLPPNLKLQALLCLAVDRGAASHLPLPALLSAGSLTHLQASTPQCPLRVRGSQGTC